MSFPTNITKIDLIKAVEKIDNVGIPSNADSQFYDVVYKGKRYPPKVIVSYANIFANGKELDRKSFEGGLGTPCFNLLQQNGFIIESKNSIIEMDAKKVWFVCQGTSFSNDKGKKYLWAPSKGKNGTLRFYWENVLKVKKGDIVFNYSDGLRGVSVAITDGYSAKNPFKDSKWNEDGYKVEIRLIKFTDTISSKQIAERKEDFNTALKNIQNKPFNINGKVNEGYLFEFTKEAGRLIKEIIGKPFGDEEIDTFFGNFELKEAPINMTTKEIINHVHRYIQSRGFKYQYEEIANFYLALKAKPFVILAGISGTGKTQLPRKFAAALGMSDNQVIQIPVRPDWTDGSELLGYTGLDGLFHPKDLTLIIQEANKNRNKPYFFILDEMNLARVEHYFSDFLSVIETREKLNGKITTDPILRKETLQGASNSKPFEGLIWPQNLYLIGTVNMDETTHTFSKKVLDRANSVEMNEVDLSWIVKTNENVESLKGITNELFVTEFLGSNDISEEDKLKIELDIDLLKKVNSILKEADLHFAYRVRDEVAFYLLINNKQGLLDPKDAIDFQLMQKVLPKIHGSSERVQKVLIELLNLLEGTKINSENFEFDEMIKPIDLDSLKFRRSTKKILFMLKRFEEDRFTSFWL